MDFPHALLCVAIPLLVVLGVKAVSSWLGNSSGLPFPPGPAPRFITGNLHDIPAQQPWLTYTDWKLRYGDIVHARIFGQHIILVNSLKTATDLFEKRSHLYSDRPAAPMIDLIGWDFTLGFIPYTNRWRQQRRLLHQSFRPDAARTYRPIQMTKIHDFLRGLLSKPEDFVALYKTHEPCAAAIIMATMYGYQVQPTEDHFVALSEKAVKMLSDAALPGAAAVNAFPLLRHLPGWLPGCGFQYFAAECRKRTEEMQQVPFDFVKQNMRDGTNAKSIVATLLEANQVEGRSCQLEQVIKEISATAYAGALTVSSLGTFFYVMALHPEIQQKAQSEIDNVIGTHRLPEFEDRASLPYIEALYREVMRWKPVLPLGVPHATIADDIYEGYFIPKGEHVLMERTWQAMTHDESIYPEPDRFNPDRFFTADGELNDDNTVLAFGFGRRICVGRHSADATIWATIASVLSAFTIVKAKDEAGNEIDIDPVYSDGMISHPRPFKCSITPRSELAQNLVEATADL
ncbi:cytochrome P450 [Mycena rosella]|uniref:Cytochrome P450 n=1 Tax=Mycena rosella TaxID=1033263 RepID=A0AAD7D9V0_MYCRO|nr:cytochrome P450 [Mycena rosella]